MLMSAKEPRQSCFLRPTTGTLTTQLGRDPQLRVLAPDDNEMQQSELSDLQLFRCKLYKD